MHKGLGLSQEAVHRIARALEAADYNVDPSSGEFIMPEGTPGVPVDDPESRLKSLEDTVSRIPNLEVEVAALQEQLEGLQQAPSATPATPPPLPQQQPASAGGGGWWNNLKNRMFTDTPWGQQSAPSYGVKSNDPSYGLMPYLGSKRRR